MDHIKKADPNEELVNNLERYKEEFEEKFLKLDGKITSVNMSQMKMPAKSGSIKKSW